ncbi:phosphotransferase [Streptomyces sp. NPDC004610]|uniref:phosphotransferase n=1 Tax=unclassified Streptomyces TaxID=2593676 RepID=UPI00339E4364
MTPDFPESEIAALIRPHAGAVREIQRTPRGFSSDLAARVDAEKGRFFVKAIRNRAGGRVASLARERLVNPYVQPLSPTLQWYARNGEWLALGFEWAEGRAAGLLPGSSDLPEVAKTVDSISRIALPHPAREWAETRWDRFVVREEDARLFRGDVLLHTDIHPSNFIMGGRRTWVVDWAWPTRGAGFIDPALLVVQLISAGHSPAEAEGWAARCAAWGGADQRAVDAFAAATLRMYRAFSRRKPDESWLMDMARACEAWADHRGVEVPPGGPRGVGPSGREQGIAAKFR